MELVKDSCMAVPWGNRLGFEVHRGRAEASSHQGRTVAPAVAVTGVSEASEDCLPLGKAEASYPIAHLDNLMVALHSPI